MNRKKVSAQKIVYTAIFVALVVILQFAGSYIKIGPISISLVLIPIVLGGILLGPLVGLLLGFTFGLITLIAGVTGLDGFTLLLFQQTPVMTVLIC